MCRTLLVLLCAVVSILSSPITDIGPCKNDDNACVTKLFGTIYKDIAVGIPSMNIEAMDPIHADEIIANLATVKYTLKNTTCIGYKQCEVVNSSLSLEDHKLHLDFVCPLFVMNGDYNINGKVLEWLVQGNGDYYLEGKDYHVAVDSDIKVTSGNNGKQYISIKSFKVTPECRGGAFFDLRNLFNGKKELAEPVLKFLNENWKPVAKELDLPVFKTFVKRLMKNYNKYFKSTPVDTLILL